MSEKPNIIGPLTRAALLWAMLVYSAAGAPAPLTAAEGAIARCGPSDGMGYYFKDELTNPTGPSWEKDGITNGKIVLIRLADEWDILLDDAIGAYSYRQDGAMVVALGATDRMITVGAFHGNFTDIYTFNLIDREVLWSSHKIGTAITKVAVYRSECTFTAAAGR